MSRAFDYIYYPEGRLTLDPHGLTFRKYSETIASQSETLLNGMSRLLSTSNWVLLGSEVFQDSEKTLAYIYLHRALLDCLPDLQEAGLTQVAVWAPANMQDAVDRLSPPFSRSLCEIAGELDTSIYVLDLIAYCRELGLRVILIRPPGPRPDDFIAHRANDRSAFVAEKLMNASSGTGGGKTLVLTSYIDLCSESRGLPDGEEFHSLASKLALLSGEEPATVRFCDPGIEAERFYDVLEDVFAVSAGIAEPGVYIIPNVSPIGSSCGSNFMMQAARYAVYVVPPNSTEIETPL